jgi:small GTP-binding protein
VNDAFSDKYLTTVGVKLSKKIVTIGSEAVQLILWDLNGEDKFQRLSTSYLRGSAAYFLVIDGTRPATEETALVLHRRARAALGDIPFIILLNKSDLTDDWAVTDEMIENYDANDWIHLRTSAKSSEGVEDAFYQIAQLAFTSTAP